jgi:hypothetical protein
LRRHNYHEYHSACAPYLADASKARNTPLSKLKVAKAL